MAGPMRYELSLRSSLYPIPAALNALGAHKSTQSPISQKCVTYLASKNVLLSPNNVYTRDFDKKKELNDGRDNDHIVKE